MDYKSFTTQLSVNLMNRRNLNVEINIKELTNQVVQQSIIDADRFVQLFLEAEMERCEYLINPTSYPITKLDEAYSAAQDYLLQFGVNMLDYIKMVTGDDWRPSACAAVEDAMIISRMIRDTLIQEQNYRMQSKQ